MFLRGEFSPRCRLCVKKSSITPTPYISLEVALFNVTLAREQVRGVPHINAFSELLMKPDAREVSALEVDGAALMQK